MAVILSGCAAIMDAAKSMQALKNCNYSITSVTPEVKLTYPLSRSSVDLVMTNSSSGMFRALSSLPAAVKYRISSSKLTSLGSTKASSLDSFCFPKLLRKFSILALVVAC